MHMLHQIKAQQFYTDLDLYQKVLRTLCIIEFIELVAKKW